MKYFYKANNLVIKSEQGPGQTYITSRHNLISREDISPYVGTPTITHDGCGGERLKSFIVLLEN